MMLNELSDLTRFLIEQEAASPVFESSSIRKHSRSDLEAMRQKSPQPESNPYCEQLAGDVHLHRSSHLCKYVWEKKNFLPFYFPRAERFDTNQGDYSAVLLSNSFAFFHIWVNGDRTLIPTVEAHLGVEDAQVGRTTEVQSRKWVALVRNPMEHFLQGWALAEIKVVQDARERGHEDLANKILAKWEERTLEERLIVFLDQLETYAKSSSTAMLSPLMHALPQTNFLMDDTGALHPNLALIADVDDWATVLKFSDFPGPIDENRKEQLSDLQLKYFATEFYKFSKPTLLRVCEFLAIDYFLLPYEAPSTCLKRRGPLDFEYRRQELLDNIA